MSHPRVSAKPRLWRPNRPRLALLSAHPGWLRGFSLRNEPDVETPLGGASLAVTPCKRLFRLINRRPNGPHDHNAKLRQTVGRAATYSVRFGVTRRYCFARTVKLLPNHSKATGPRDSRSIPSRLSFSYTSRLASNSDHAALARLVVLQQIAITHLSLQNTLWNRHASSDPLRCLTHGCFDANSRG